MTYPPPPPTTYTPRPKAPGLAIASLVTGIVGLALVGCLLFLPVLPILAIIFGHLSLSTINKSGLPGRGMAIAGLITGYAGLVVSILLLVLLIVGTLTPPTPNF